ncbi:MAG: hypothetical protein CMK59_09315 [Proteobacteria bacterium]|nr:hypothetical protein [Pseudomonadota bacterium]
MSTKQKIAELMEDQSNKALLQLGFVYLALFCIWGGLAFGAQHGLVLLIPCLFLMGIVQYYVVISGHEAVHKTLCSSLKLNEFFGVLGQSLVGVSFTAYRQQHLDHHKALHNDHDPDAHIYMGVLSAPPGWKRFVFLTLGTFIEIAIKIRQKGSGGYGSERKLSKKIQRNMKRDSLLVIFAQLCLIAVSSLVLSSWVELYWPSNFLETPNISNVQGWFSLLCSWGFSYALLWITPLFGITVFLNRCRIVIEHGLALKIAEQLVDNTTENPQKKLRIPTVDIVPSPIERLLFAPFLFNYHCSHHLFMGVPHYHLPALHESLKDNQYPGHYTLKGGYLKALWTVIFV